MGKNERSSDDRAIVAPFPVVGIGASAGGLEAFTQLLPQLPADSGMAFVLIQHLDPRHKSILVDVLRPMTRLPVIQVRHGERVRPDHIYVMPPDADVSIEGGEFRLSSRAKHSGRPHLPIDAFFTALAADRGDRAIGVVLSGTASDGTNGLRAIKERAGIALAQEPKTAKFGSMPQSAIDAGVVDHALSIPRLAKELVRLSRHPYLIGARRASRSRPSSRAPSGRKRPDGTDDGPVLVKIMMLVKTVVGTDLAEYRSPTIERRLARRMALRGVKDRSAYLGLLEREPGEVRALGEDVLIHVSSFFRDPQVFETLKRTVFPEILKHKAEGAPIRIWVAGCAGGEEVYSLALCLLELLGDSTYSHPVQIFGSDVSEHSVLASRNGTYSEAAMRGVSEERRRRYFTKTENGFRINKTVRDLCVFIRHDLARDPPFSKLDLISCRNVLIYFDQTLQKRVLPTFHYGLNQPGFLLLGRTEHISGFNELFFPIGGSSKIFARSALPSRLSFLRQLEPRGDLPPASTQQTADPGRRVGDIGRHLDKLLLARYAPPAVLVDDKLEVVQFRGRIGSFLQPAPGEPQTNVIKMARGGLLSKLRTTLARARREMAPVRTEGVEIHDNGSLTTCDILVIPFAGLPQLKEPLFVILFEATPVTDESPRVRRAKTTARDARRIATLEHELSATSEYLRSLIEDQNRSNADLGSANEELVSGNEELQSLNEELETAKEELQSTNEELTTVNDELHIRNLETAQINLDLVNLLDTIDMPLVILDGQRHIRRFTPQVRNILNLLPSDVGRPFGDIKPNIDVPDLDRQVAEVIATLIPRDWEVQDKGGRWFRIAIRPHQGNDPVGGAIVSFLDIHTFKHHLSEIERAKDAAERADRAKDQFLAVLSHELRTPLAALLMQTQLLRQAGPDEAKQDRACEAIERSTQLQVKLIDDLLDVSRIVTGKMKIELRSADLVAAVRAALDGLATLIAHKSIELRVFLDSTLAPVAGDRTRLEQVVFNLVGNAIKFTPPGGVVTVSLKAAGGQAHLAVSDTGVGIEPSFLPHVFERLTQGDGSSTRSHNGLGLGLAIVHYIVEAHAGTVRAESAGPGHGATFRVSLPLIPGPLKRSGAANPSKRKAAKSRERTFVGRLAGRRVLLVEDNRDVRDALAEMLVITGATVRTAESAAVAMRIFRRFRPHALVCDIAMPGEDGYAFIAKIRALKSRDRNVPALALTALAGNAARRRALGAGFQMYLAKPIEAGRFAETMNDLLNLKARTSIRNSRVVRKHS